MCPADIIRMNGKGRPAASESNPSQLVRAIDELASQWAARRAPQPSNAQAPKADIIPFPLKETLDEQCARFKSLIAKLDPHGLALVSLVSCAFTPDPPEAVLDGPDAELIQQCDRLNVVQAAMNAMYKAIPDDKERDVVLDPLNIEWFKAKARIFRLGGPRTPEGARAAASVLLDQYPDGVNQDADLASWLSFHCAKYLSDHDRSSGSGLGFE